MSLNSSPVRLFVQEKLQLAKTIRLSPKHSMYLIKVMRRNISDVIYLFNGQDGEWKAIISSLGVDGVIVFLDSQCQLQSEVWDLQLLFAPVKRANIELMLQKTTELGITNFTPIKTVNTDVVRFKPDRLMSIAIEASEQSRRLTVPKVGKLEGFVDFFGHWSHERTLFVLDQGVGSCSFGDSSLLNRKQAANGVSFLVGPEGGLTLSELDQLRDLPFSEIVSLGARILRAETAAIAAISVWQAICGEWCQNK